METIRTNKSLNFTFGVLTCTGIWMPASFVGNWKGNMYRIFSFFMVVGTLVIYVVTESIDIYVNLGDLEKNVETALLCVTLSVALVKSTKVISERENIRRLVNKFDEPSFSRVSKANGKYLRKAMMLTKLYSMLLTSAAVGTTTLWAVYPLFDKSSHLPLRAWYPWDSTVHSTFIMLHIYQAISIIILGFLNSNQDVLICSIVLLFSGQFDVLYSDISALSTPNQESGQGSNRVDNTVNGKINERVSEEEDIKVKLKRLILHQKDLINCIEEVERLFSGMVFLQFMASCTVICATAFQLSLTPFSWEYVSNFLYMWTMLVEVFLYCYPGNELMIKSALIADAAYHTTWYNEDLDFRKMLILVMERSKRPVIVTAGRIMPLTLSTLTSILRSSYSFYAVLRTMHDV